MYEMYMSQLALIHNSISEDGMDLMWMSFVLVIVPVHIVLSHRII